MFNVTLSEAMPLVSLKQGDNSLYIAPLHIRGHCERAMFATTGALAPQRSPEGPCHAVTEGSFFNN